MTTEPTPDAPGLPVTDGALRDLIDWHKRDGTKKGVLTHSALVELLSARQSRPLPSDWVAVPREPTEEMCNAMRISVGDGIAMKPVYAAMLAAAPSAPAEGSRTVEDDVRAYGTGYTLDGQRIDPSRITVVTAPEPLAQGDNHDSMTVLEAYAQGVNDALAGKHGAGQNPVMYQQIHRHQPNAQWTECDKATFDQYTDYHRQYGGTPPVRALYASPQPAAKGPATPTLPVDVRGQWYEVPVPVQLHIVMMREKLNNPATFFADDASLAAWLDGLRATNDDGAVTDEAWEPAQRAAAFLRGEMKPATPNPPQPSASVGDDEPEPEDWRIGWALAYAGWALYTDDGELQDNREAPFIDFRRDDASVIRKKIAQRAIAKGRYIESAALDGGHESALTTAAGGGGEVGNG